MKKPKKARELVLVLGEDWICVYENGHVVFQDHRFASDTLIGLEISSSEFQKMREDAIYAEDYDGHFPDSLKDLKQELKLPI
jgi:hypothetical protein